jgi:hypothetical protein
MCVCVVGGVRHGAILTDSTQRKPGRPIQHHREQTQADTDQRRTHTQPSDFKPHCIILLLVLVVLVVGGVVGVWLLLRERFYKHSSSHSTQWLPPGTCVCVGYVVE